MTPIFDSQAQLKLLSQIAFSDPQYLEIRTFFFQMLQKATTAFREIGKDSTALLDWTTQCDVFNKASATIPLFERVSAWNPNHEETKKVQELFLKTFECLKIPFEEGSQMLFINFHMLFYTLFNHTNKELESTATREAQRFIQQLFPRQVPAQPKVPAQPAVLSSDEKEIYPVQELPIDESSCSEQTTPMGENDINFVMDVSKVVKRLWPDGKILSVTNGDLFDELQAIMKNSVNHDNAKKIKELISSLIRVQTEYTNSILDKDNRDRSTLDLVLRNEKLFEELFKTLQDTIDQSTNYLS